MRPPRFQLGRGWTRRRRWTLADPAQPPKRAACDTHPLAQSRDRRVVVQTGPPSLPWAPCDSVRGAQPPSRVSSVLLLLLYPPPPPVRSPPGIAHTSSSGMLGVPGGCTHETVLPMYAISRASRCRSGVHKMTGFAPAEWGPREPRTLGQPPMCSHRRTFPPPLRHPHTHTRANLSDLYVGACVCICRNLRQPGARRFPLPRRYLARSRPPSPWLVESRSHSVCEVGVSRGGRGRGGVWIEAPWHYKVPFRFDFFLFLPHRRAPSFAPANTLNEHLAMP
ncbi:hypothetical protein LX36DRAFT_342266 [Colletotrichum falcatum]|nr:hypothetical protein LX36DRAFT_342266 [Colletotrichum falcatum]